MTRSRPTLEGLGELVADVVRANVDNDPWVGRLVGERFRVIAHLADGGMSSVYRAEDTVEGQEVALKLVPRERLGDADVVARMVREAELAALLEHPAVVRTIAAGAAPMGGFYVALELLEGESLESHLEANGPPPLEVALLLLEQLAAGLDHAHARGIVHRDIKPGNVMITRGADGMPLAKLIDFGLARLLDVHGHTVTRAGTLVGTPAYMAPETVDLSRPMGAAADRYSLAAIAFELISGDAPYANRSIPRLLEAILTEPPRTLASMQLDAPRVDAVIAQGLARSPDARHPSCAALVADLRAALDAGDRDRLPRRTSFAVLAPTSGVRVRPPLVSETRTLAGYVSSAPPPPAPSTPPVAVSAERTPDTAITLEDGAPPTVVTVTRRALVLAALSCFAAGALAYALASWLLAQ